MNKLNVIYEDNHIIVVEKSPNILSQSDITGDIDMLTIFKEYIKEKYHKPGNVYLGLLHRLDRPVGGLMIFAKTSKAAARMSKQIKNHEMKKSYLAVVNGFFDNKKGHFTDYLKKLPNGNTVISDVKNGKIAELDYYIRDYNSVENKSLVEINLQTGRHHQIRVQFASRGHSLCGDQRYGMMDKTQIALYAYKLEFMHPVTKEKMILVNYPKKNKYWTMFTL